MSASICFLLLNDFSTYWEEIASGLKEAGLTPSGFRPQDKNQFLNQLLEHNPDAVLIAGGSSGQPPRFHFEAVKRWMAEQQVNVPIWMLIEPQEEEKAVKAMYKGLADYFFTDRLTRLIPSAVLLAGRDNQTLVPCHLNQILEGVIEECRPLFQERGLSLTFLPGVDLPLVPAEPALLAQAVLAILKKIAAVPPQTGAGMRTYLDAVKGEVCLEIKLTGDGLQTEDQIEAAELSEETLREPAQVIEGQNGRIEVDAGEEFGIHIGLSFPAILQERIAGSPQLLVVENSLLMRSILQEALEQEGFIVRTAENGLDALEKMAAFLPDLIISDIAMPMMDGFDFFESVRARQEWQDLPFIFVTGQSDQREHLNTQVLRGATYLIKPIIIEELLVAVRSRLSK